MRRGVTLAMIVGALLAGVSAPMQGVISKPKFTLTSTAFSNNSTIPVQYTCTGAGTRPGLAWEHVPSGTKELAMIVEDPDAPIGTFVHWVVAGIQPKPTSMAGDTDPVGAVQGANGTGRPGWQPPCPPAGPVHHYIFTLFALKKKVTLPPGGNAATLRDAMKGKVLARAKLVGLYGA